MAENTVIDLDLIRRSPSLKKLKALPGDELDSENYLIRKFSTKPDPSEQDVPEEERSILDEFLYAFEEAGRGSTYLTDILERNFPLGRFTLDSFYVTPETAYGKDFEKASVEKRKDLIAASKQRSFIESYGIEEPTGTVATIGEIVGTVADPLNALPFGIAKGVGQAITSGYTLAAGYSALEDYAKKGEIDPITAIAFGGFGALTGGALEKGLQFVGKAGKRAANRRINDVEERVNQKIKMGVSPNAALKEALTEQDVRVLQRDMVIAERVPQFAKTQTRAEELLQKQIANDSATSRLYSKTVDKLLGTLSTRIGNISQPILQRVRRFEYDVHKNTSEYLRGVEPFMKDLKNLKGQLKKDVARHLNNGDFEAARSLMSKPMRENFDTVQAVLKQIFKGSQEAGLEMGRIENFFPRLVNRYDDLVNKAGRKRIDKISAAQREYATKQGLNSEADLDTETKTKIANYVLRGYELKLDSGLPKFARPRKLAEIPPELEEFYAQPEEALQLYIRNAVNNMERSKFLGRTGPRSDPKAIEQSIGAVVEAERAAGRLNAEQVVELNELLKSRFIGGEQSPDALFRELRNTGYLGTIANPISALTQLGDLGVSGAMNGLRNTFAAMFKTKDLKAIDLGLNQIGQEFVSQGLTSRLLDKTLGASLFKTVDRLGKETYMNASLRKNFKMVTTPKGEQKFRKQWSKFYGDDIEALVADLKSGKVTDMVKYHTFNELSDVQPISSLEMPQAYLDHPNGRVLYSLKSFAIKQADIARRKIVQEWNKGNKVQATKNAAAIVGYMTASGVGVQTVKDLILLRDVQPDDIPETALWSLLGVYGLNKYMSDKYLSEGKVSEAAANMFLPPTPLIDAFFGVTNELTEEDPDTAKYVRAFPVVGPMFYNYFLGGAEKYNERLRED